MEELPPRLRWVGWLRGVVLPLLLLAAIVAGLWYFGLRDDDGSTTVDGETSFGAVELPPGKNATGEGPAGKVDSAAPDFLLEQLDGEPLRLSDLQGRPVIVNFWATWCTPCRREIPELIDIYDANKDRGLVVIGVNLQEGDRPVRDFAEEFGIDYPLVMDRSGQVAETWRVGGPIGGLPASYFVDSDGVIRALFFGQMNEDVLLERLTSILPPEPEP